MASPRRSSRVLLNLRPRATTLEAGNNSTRTQEVDKQPSQGQIVPLTWPSGVGLPAATVLSRPAADTSPGTSRLLSHNAVSNIADQPLDADAAATINSILEQYPAQTRKQTLVQFTTMASNVGSAGESVYSMLSPNQRTIHSRVMVENRQRTLESSLTKLWGGRDWIPQPYRKKWIHIDTIRALIKITELVLERGQALSGLWEAGGLLRTLADTSRSRKLTRSNCLEALKTLQGSGTNMPANSSQDDSTPTGDAALPPTTLPASRIGISADNGSPTSDESPQSRESDTHRDARFEGEADDEDENEVELGRRGASPELGEEWSPRSVLNTNQISSPIYDEGNLNIPSSPSSLPGDTAALDYIERNDSAGPARRRRLSTLDEHTEPGDSPPPTSSGQESPSRKRPRDLGHFLPISKRTRPISRSTRSLVSQDEIADSEHDEDTAEAEVGRAVAAHSKLQQDTPAFPPPPSILFSIQGSVADRRERIAGFQADLAAAKAGLTEAENLVNDLTSRMGALQSTSARMLARLTEERTLSVDFRMKLVSTGYPACEGDGQIQEDINEQLGIIFGPGNNTTTTNFIKVATALKKEHLTTELHRAQDERGFARDKVKHIRLQLERMQSIVAFQSMIDILPSEDLEELGVSCYTRGGRGGS